MDETANGDSIIPDARSSLVSLWCRAGAEALLEELAFPSEELAFGHTKIFIRSPRTVSVGARGDPAMGRVGASPMGPIAALGDPAQCPGCPQLFDLERRRQERVVQLATLIQKMIRGWRCRTQYQLMRKSQIILSAWFRGHAVRMEQGGGLVLDPQAGPWSSPHLSHRSKRTSTSR